MGEFHFPGRSMNRRSFLKASSAASLAAALPSAPFAAAQQSNAGTASKTQRKPHPQNPETLLLKDYRPLSIYKIPVTEVAKAKFPIIDMHSHPYAKTPAQIAEWVRTMDEVGIEKTIILAMATGAEFDKIYKDYSQHGDRFEMWCGLDFTGYKTSQVLFLRGEGTETLRPDWRTRRGRNSRQRRRTEFGQIYRARHASLTIPAWIPSSKLAPNSKLPSACTSRTRSGCTRKWTAPTTA